ncbi:hypothetical protein [Sciscionella marina]|uniref:hypothetical protein n=1 Tax=Sciscionella marina TaxID=508770 RepID=UPI000370313F|nr:hypothetical protein [Sciscionella marina]
MNDRSDDRYRGAMFWLPDTGFGNGVPASHWAELADLPEGELAPVLFALFEADIGAYAARRHPPLRLPDAHSPYRLWVDSLYYRSAEEVLMTELARLHGVRPPTIED